MITCLIVDDEPLAREELADLLSSSDDIEIIGQCSNAIEAVQSIARDKPQLVFLDIQMPKISGIELISMLDQPSMPKIVFVTAYDEFALKAFDHHALDYLLKPIDENRLAQTLARARENLAPQQQISMLIDELKHIPCYSGHRLKVIPIKDVQYISSELSGVHVYTATESVNTQLTLKVLETRSNLIQCHRQYLIAPLAISEIILEENGAQIMTHSGARVPVSRRYLKSLKQQLGFQ